MDKSQAPILKLHQLFIITLAALWGSVQMESTFKMHHSSHSIEMNEGLKQKQNWV